MRAYEAMFKGMRQTNPKAESHTPTVKQVSSSLNANPEETKQGSTTKEETV